MTLPLRIVQASATASRLLETMASHMTRAHRRLSEYFRAWRDRHEATADPLCDETLDQFCVGDIAVVFEEYKRLSRLEERLIQAMGPPAVRMRYNRKTGDLEIDDTWTDPDGD